MSLNDGISVWSARGGKTAGGGGCERRKERIRIKKEEPVLTLRRQQRILIRASLESSEQRLNCRFCLFEQRAPFKHTGCFLKIPQAARKPTRDVRMK